MLRRVSVEDVLLLVETCIGKRVWVGNIPFADSRMLACRALVNASGLCCTCGCIYLSVSCVLPC